MKIKELLKQYRSICKEIEEKNIELKNRTVFGAVRGSDSEFPYTQHTMQVCGVEPSKENTRLMTRLKSLEKQKETVDQFIDGIEDSLTRRIFELRYISGDCRKPSWQRIAFQIGEHDESYPRRVHNKYLKLAENAEFSVL